MDVARDAGPSSEDGGRFLFAPTTPTPKVTKASSTCGRARKCSAALTPLEWSVFSRRFGFDEEPNFEGAWNAHVFVSLEQIAKELQLDAGEVETAGEFRTRQAARDPQQTRVAGTRRQDSQSWNALAIRGLAIAARSIGQARIRRGRGACARIPARQPVAPIQDGTTARDRKDGVSHLNAYLDDYAYLANALLEMLQLRWRNEDVAWLREILDAMLDALRGRGARRVLLHLRRSRNADPPQQELQRRRDSRRQWHRGARADPRRLPVRRDTLARSRRAHAARRVARHQSLSARTHEPARSTGRVPGSARDPDHPRDRGRRRLATRTRRTLRAASHGVLDSRGSRRPGCRDRRQESRRELTRLCVPRIHLFGTGGNARGSHSHGAGASAASAPNEPCARLCLLASSPCDLASALGLRLRRAARSAPRPPTCAPRRPATPHLR